jgi:hypothetical protein
MRNIAIIVAILAIAAMAFAQDSMRQHYYCDAYNFANPLLMPDGVTPIPDGTFYEFVLCADQAHTDSEYQSYANDYAATKYEAGVIVANINLEDTAIIDAYYGGFNMDYWNSTPGYFYPDYMQIFSDPIGQPGEPNLTCLDKYYIRVYNTSDKRTATAYRTCTTQVGPAINSFDAEWELTNWNPWVMLTDPHPVPAVNPTPADAATSVSVDADLAWDYVVDAAHANPENFRILYGTASDLTGATVTTIPYVNGTVGYTYALPTLAYSTTYYWQIVPFNSLSARDARATRGASRKAANRADAESCPIWSFTTEANPVSDYPVEVVNPFPTEGATAINVDTVLGWDYVTDALHMNPTQFDVYFNTIDNFTGVTPTVVAYVNGQEHYTNALPTLAYDTTYYWMVYACNGANQTPSPTWCFTTEANPVSPNPTVAVNPIPADAATGVVHTAISLNWEYITDPLFTDPIEFKVYYGTASDLTGATMVNVAYTTGQVAYSTVVGDLAYGTTYYWQVVPFNALRTARETRRVNTRGEAINCPIWCFATEAYTGNIDPSGDPTAPFDPGNGTNVVIDPPAGFSGNIGVNGLVVPPVTTPTFGAQQTGTELYYEISGTNEDGTPWDHWPVRMTFTWTAPVPDVTAVPNVWTDHSGTWEMIDPTWIVAAETDLITSPYHITFDIWHFSTWTPGWSTTVPVEFSGFTASYIGTSKIVNLNWNTASETDMNGYKVMRSTDSSIETASIISSMIPATNEAENHRYNFQDSNVQVGSTYYYWVEEYGLGHNQTHGPASVYITPEVVVPYDQMTRLESAYPNPFNPTVNVKFSVKQGDKATIVVYNMLGQVVKNFGSFDATKNGNVLTWNGADDSNRPVCSGIYFFKMKSGSTVSVQKVMLLK